MRKRESKLMRRGTAVNDDRKRARAQTMTPNTGMCLCVLTLGNKTLSRELSSRKESEPGEVWTMKVLRQSSACLERLKRGTLFGKRNIALYGQYIS